VVTDAKGVILGATIVGASAGEQIVAWALALNHGLDVRAFADMIVPYPTYMDIGKRAAATFFAPRLPTSWAWRLLNLLRRLG
jgi:pyruvate/2-oxoglutarate dehydrogenase complex dihydrolipoamide dehydrogenase (E3) component